MRYFNGELQYEVTSLGSGGFGFPWGHSRTYSNQLYRSQAVVSEDQGHGFNWLVQQWPYLTVDSDNTTYSVNRGMEEPLFFLKSGSTYNPTFGAEDRYTLTHDAVNGLYQLTDPEGTLWEFKDLNTSGLEGLFYRAVSAGGQETKVTVYSSESIGELERSYNNGTHTYTEQYQYTYSSGQLASVTLRRKVDSGSWTNVRREAYTYYGSSETSGNLGDLKTAILQLPSGSSSWTDHENYHYRYYKDSASGTGFKHGLKYVAGPEGYQRMTDASINPLTVADGTLANYADYYFEFNSDQRVTKEVVAAGTETYTFAYTMRTGTLTDDYNKWRRKVVMTQPDSNTVTVFTNHIGQVILHELKEVSTSKTWLQYFEYDSQARGTLHARPSAVSTWSLASTSSELSVTVRTSDGLIELTDYPTSTTATSSTLGDAKGYEKAQKIKQGSGGTAITLREFKYYQRTAGSLTIYPLGRSTVYRNDNGTGAINTDFSYSWFSGTVLAQERVTTLPSISTGQNGSGASNTQTQRFSAWGDLIWSLDERGFINYQAYDIVRGALTQSIVDVDGSQLTLPSGWSTPTGGGLHLITDYTVDDLGRATRTMGPVHAVDISGTSTNVRMVTWTVIKDDTDEMRTAQGYASGSSFGTFTLVNPVSITKLDQAGRAIERIMATRGSGVTSSGELSSSDTFAQSTYVRWTKKTYSTPGYLAKIRLYHTIPTSGSGSYYTNYYDTNFLHDNMGRQSQVTTPGGTITQRLYEARGFTTSVKVGALSSIQIQPRRSWQNPFEPLDADYDGDIDANDSQTVLDWVNAGTPVPEPPTSPPPPPPYPDTNGDGFVAPGDILSAINWVNNGGAHNELTVAEFEYDGSSGGGDGNLTTETRWIDSNSSNNRVTVSTFDWRNRRMGVDGEVDLYVEYQYDNLNQLTVVLRRNTTSSGTVVNKQESRYDDLGRVYQRVRYAVDVSTGSVGNSLTDNTWYDPAGNVAKSQPAGSKAFRKAFYDLAGRTIKTFIGYDTSETSYVDALTVTGDTIFEQTETTYDPSGNVIQTTSKRRFHDATGTGELTSPSGSQPKARVMYVAMYSDFIDRTAAVANYGTNGGSSFTRSATIPTRSDTILVNSTEFNIRGEAYRTIDPAGRDDRVEFDYAGRKTKTIQNYDDGDPTTGAPDKDVTVEYTYNPDGKVRTVKARQQSTSDDQVTTYVYGVTTGAGSTLYSRELLYAVVYPDASDFTDLVKYKYNRQGQVIEMTDQNGTVHAYDFDKLGRQTQDRVTTLASGVDGAVRRIGSTYEVRGLREKLTTYDTAAIGSGSVLNEVQNAYNDFGQLISQYQEHSGAVSTGTSPQVQYAHASGSANHIRSTSMTYPNGRIVRYEYSSGADDNLSRFSYLADDSSGSVGTHLAEYAYMGLGTVVTIDYPEPDIRMDLVTGSGNDPYDGLDRFDRIADRLWRDYGRSVDVVRIKHGYDRASNRLWREDPVAAGNSKDFDELSTFDGVYRLKTFKRGNLNTNKDGIASGTLQFEQQWGFDPLGNWSSFKEDAAGDGTFELDQTRTVNKVNEITGTSGGSWAVPTHDRNGNSITSPQPNNPTSIYTIVYDAWNRLVSISSTAGAVITTAYNGMNWSITNTIGGNTTRVFYSNDWALIEERLSGSSFASTQYVWRHDAQDALLLRDRDTGILDNVLDERLYGLTGTHDILALSNSSGNIVERFWCTPYGGISFLSSSFANASSSYAWKHIYRGYIFDSASSLHFVRYRTFHSQLGKWLNRDPLEYISGVNLYEYVSNRPTKYWDPYGLDKQDHHWLPQLEGEGTKYVDKLCCKHGINLNIHDYTTTLETGTGHPHSYLHATMRPKWHEIGRAIYKMSKDCCEMMTLFSLAVEQAWVYMDYLHNTGQLSALPPFELHYYQKPGSGDTRAKWSALYAKACAKPPSVPIPVAVPKQQPNEVLEVPAAREIPVPPKVLYVPNPYRPVVPPLVQMNCPLIFHPVDQDIYWDRGQLCVAGLMVAPLLIYGAVVTLPATIGGGGGAGAVGLPTAGTAVSSSTGTFATAATVSGVAVGASQSNGKCE